MRFQRCKRYKCQVPDQVKLESRCSLPASATPTSSAARVSPPYVLLIYSSKLLILLYYSFNSIIDLFPSGSISHQLLLLLIVYCQPLFPRVLGHEGVGYVTYIYYTCMMQTISM